MPSYVHTCPRASEGSGGESYQLSPSIAGDLERFRVTVKAKKLETGLRPISAGIPYTLLLRIEAIGFPTFGLLLYRAYKDGTFITA